MDNYWNYSKYETCRLEYQIQFFNYKNELGIIEDTLVL